MAGKYAQLIGLLEEESEIASDDEENRDVVGSMTTALRKLRNYQYRPVSPTFTNAEIEGIKFALGDIGELYRFAGTSSGYRMEDSTPDEIASARVLGNMALRQANSLGIKL